MQIETTIEIDGEDVMLDVEFSFYKRDPDVGYFEDWIELDAALDCEGKDILKALDEDTKAVIECRCWDDIGAANEIDPPDYYYEEGN